MHLLVLRREDQGETAAADARALRLDHSESESGGHRSVDGVAPAPQKRCARLGGEGMSGRHCAARRDGGESEQEG